MEEIWKDVPGYEGLYQVSNLGRVKSLKRIVITKIGKKYPVKEMVLKPILQNNGYLTFNLCNNTKNKVCSIHRMVAEIFIPNPFNLLQVNHKDEVKTNNNAENLEWCNQSYNRNYGTCQERITARQRKKVIQMDLNGEIIKEWVGVNDAGRNGFSASKISLCCNGKRNKHKGYLWNHI